MDKKSFIESEKKETYLLRIDKDLFFQISDYVQKMKKNKGRKNYSFNKFVLEAIDERLKKLFIK